MQTDLGEVILELTRNGPYLKCSAVHAATDERLTFAPDPSSQSRACLGGAIGNDACGNRTPRRCASRGAATDKLAK